jgi:AraC-like DNA-binding protein
LRANRGRQGGGRDAGAAAFFVLQPQERGQIIDMSERSLQRRLAEAGMTFQQLRDRVRADIALKYLRQSSLGAAQIGEILGYSGPAAFSRAFRRQHGFSPQQARSLPLAKNGHRRN